MWIFGFFLTIVFMCGSQAEVDDCDRNPVPLCMPPNRQPLSFPETEGNLEYMCITGIELLECILRKAQDCGEDHFLELEGHKLGMMKFVCNKENPIFHAIARNLKCLKTVSEEYDYTMCHKLILGAGDRMPKDDWQKLYDLFTIGNNTAEERELKICYNIEFESACMVAQISKICGTEIKETAQRVISESKMLEKLCTPKNAEVVNQFGRYLEMEVDKI